MKTHLSNQPANQPGFRSSAEARATTEDQSQGGSLCSSAAADLAMDRYAADGSDVAFAELYDLLAPRLVLYLLRQTRDRARAEDLMQQTMLQLHRQRGRFIRGSKVTPWAFAIARRYLIDCIRSEKHQKATIQGFSECQPPPPAGVDEIVSSMQLASRLTDEVARLPDNQRVALELIKQDGLSLREAAQVLGTTMNAIKLRLHRAYIALKGAVAVPDARDDEGT